MFATVNKKPRKPQQLLIAACISSVLLLPADAAQATIDEVQAGLLSQFQQPLRWDNVESDRLYWRAGATPTWREPLGLHALRLEPGQSVTLLLPANEMLRLHSLQQALPQDALSVAMSNGTGLYLDQIPSHTDEGRDWLFDGFGRGPQLTRITLSSEARASVDVALFVSRRESMGTIAPYRSLRSLAGKPVDLRRDDEAVAQPHWSLGPQATHEIDVDGPVRFALQSRLYYQATDSTQIQHWQIEAHLNDLPWQQLNFESSSESAFPVTIDGREALVSREKAVYLEIPPGRHRLSLASGTTQFIRLLAQDTPDYLLPGLNAPSLSAKLVRDKRSAFSELQSSANTVQHYLSTNNQQRASGLVAAAASLRAAERRPDLPELLNQANEALLFHTAYRDLMPRDIPNKLNAGDFRFAWYLKPSLKDIGPDDRGALLWPQHLNEALDGLQSGYFFSLPGKSEENGAEGKFSYNLPERFAPSFLQVAVHSKSAGAQDILYLQYDDQPPVALTLANFPQVSADQFRPSTSEAALRLLGERFAGYGDGTLSAAFGERRIPAALIAVSSLEIPLPQGVQQIRLWRKDNAATPIWIALKARLGNTYSMSEQSHLSIRGRESALTAFLVALQGKDSQSPRDELVNHWQPLIRLVRAEAKGFGLAITVPAPTPQPAMSQASPAQIALAKKQATQGQWLSAFEIWSKIAQHGLPSEREIARQGQITALRQLGEDWLAEQLLKQQMLYAAEPNERARARAELVDIYRSAADFDALEATFATALATDPWHETPAIIHGLTEALLANNQPELALNAALLLDPALRPTEMVLRAAHALQWWQIFENSITQLPSAERQHYWRARRLLTEGRFDAAETLLQQAGAEGLALFDHLARAKAILANPEGKITSDWAQWITDHPGARVWKDVTFLALDFAGTESLYSVDRDIHFKMFRSEPGRPLRLLLVGPVQLKIGARPLHLKGNQTPIEGWFSVHSEDRLWRTPITQNSPSAGLTVVGRPDWLPGREVSQTISLGPGWNEVVIEGDGQPLLLRAQVEQDDYLLPVLPLLTSDTVGETVVLPRQASAGIQDEAWRRANGQWQSLLTWPTDRSNSALVERMQSLLWIGEHYPEHYLAALALAEAIHADNPGVPGLSSLLDRLARNSSWDTLDIVDASAGLRSRPTLGGEPETPSARIRRALVPTSNPDERLLANANRLVVSFQNPNPAAISISLASVDVGALPAETMTVMLQLDSNAPQRISLPANAGPALQKLVIPSGKHSLRLWIEKPLQNQFLKISVKEAGREQIFETQERFYHVATPHEPVRIKVAGPAWLRIDEWIDEQSESSYRWVEKDVDELVLFPRKGRQEGLYRIHLRSVSYGRSLPASRLLVSRPTPVPPPSQSVADRPFAQRISFVDGLQLGGQEDGLWSFGVASQQRLYGREGGPASSTALEKFVEASATYRYFAPDRNAYYRADLLARRRTHGEPTLGMEGLAQFSPSQTNWNLTTEGSLFMQQLTGQHAPAWSWKLGATLSQKRDLNPKLWHLPKLAVFARDGSFSKAEAYPTEQIDQDVFTRYKAQHRRGVALGDTLSARPWLDTELHLGANLVSNNDFNLFKPDYLSTAVGWRQLAGPFWLNLQWGANHYLRDNDRAKASRNSELSLALGWENWLPRQERIEVSANVKRDMEAGQLLLGLSLTWHFGNGRAFRDFRPGEIRFADLRKRRSYDAGNNFVSERP